MTQIDSSIPLGVRAPNLGDLADSYFGAKKFKEDQLASKQSREVQLKQAGYQANADKRAGAQEVRAQGEYDQGLTDLATKRRDARHAKLNSLLGEEAEAMASLSPEKRSLYYKQHLLPGLAEEGFDINDMPEYSDELINGWRQKAMTPGERSAERKSSASASASASAQGGEYNLKIHGATGRYYRSYKDGRPSTWDMGPDGTPADAPPQMGVVQGANGPEAYSFPRSGGTPTAVPITNPGGTPVGRPKQSIPTTVQTNIRENMVQVQAIKLLQQEMARPNAERATGPDKALINMLPFGRQINDFFSPDGRMTRIGIAQISSLKMKDISGAVINASEWPRLAQWIPNIEDNKALVESKLKNFMQQVLMINQEIAAQYSSKQGYKEDPLLKGQGSQAPAPTQAPAPKKAGPTSEADFDNMSEEELKAYDGGH